MRAPGFGRKPRHPDRQAWQSVPHRPLGELCWIHLGQPEQLPAARDLGQRLVSARRGLSLLITQPPGYELDPADTVPGPLQKTWLIAAHVPEDTAPLAADFLERWSPDIGFWIWGGLRRHLLNEAGRIGVPMHLVAATEDGLSAERRGWLSGRGGSEVSVFDSASVQSADAAEKLERMGLPEERITLHGPLQATGRILPYRHTDLEDLTAQIAGRPLWLAADATPAEWKHVLAAHREAMRGSHRLLLVMSLSDARQVPDLVARLQDNGMTYAIWGDGGWPLETTQVLVADQPGELGLWYRLAMVSFMGGSLAPEERTLNPLSAAALGTAILYGPQVRHQLYNYSRLVSAGAARIVNDGASLGAAVTQVMAPERAAAMAHAGWDVVTEGAGLVDSVIELVQDTLDARMAQNRST